MSQFNKSDKVVCIYNGEWADNSGNACTWPTPIFQRVYVVEDVSSAVCIGQTLELLALVGLVDSWDSACFRKLDELKAEIAAENELFKKLLAEE